MNPLYHDIVINEDNIPHKLTEGLLSSDDDMENNVDVSINSVNDTIEDTTTDDGIEDPLNECRISHCETALINENVTDEMIISPCEGRQPIALHDDDFGEELAHPALFPHGTFGYKVKCEVPLSPIQYFNQRLGGGCRIYGD